MRRWTILALIAAGCGTPEAPTAPAEPAPTAEAPSTPPAPTAEAPPQEPEPDPLPTASGPVVDLLHAVPTTVTVSSAYRADPAQAARIVDGETSTAWNSASGDLVGAWIEVTVPDAARVTELTIVPGFAAEQGGRDLFTANHRVARVRVERAGEALGEFALDVSRREPQPLSVDAPGGTLRVVVTEVLEGSRPDWRETCVSELGVRGHAEDAAPGEHTPRLRVADPPAEGFPEAAAETGTGDTDGDDSADAAPAPPVVADAAYFRVGDALLRLGPDGVERLAEDIYDFAVADDGDPIMILNDNGAGLVAFEGGARRSIPLPPGRSHVGALALTPNDEPVVASDWWVHLRRGGAWQDSDVLEPDLDPEMGQQPMALVVDDRGTVWARGQSDLFSRRGARWDGASRWSEARLGSDSRVSDVATRGGVTAAVNSHDLCVWRPGWRHYRNPLGRFVMASVAVGADGTVVAGGHEAVVILADGADPRSIPLEGAGVVSRIARDTRGRTWAGASGGLWVLGPEGQIVGRWARGAFPGLGGVPSAMVVTGRGPELPAP